MPPFTNWTVAPIKIPDFIGTRQRRQKAANEQEEHDLNMRVKRSNFEELLRVTGEGEALRTAQAAAVTPPKSATVNTGELKVGALTLPGQRVKVGMNARMDGRAALDNIAANPEIRHLYPAAERKYTALNAEEEKQAAAVKEALGKADKATLSAIGEKMKVAGRMMLDFKNTPPEKKPAAYAAAIPEAIKQGLIQPGTMPETYTPEVDAIIDRHIANGQTVAEWVRENERKRHNLKTEEHAENTLKARLAGKLTGGLKTAKLSKAAVDKWAATFYETGELPTMGAAAKADIINRAVQLYPEMKITVRK